MARSRFADSARHEFELFYQPLVSVQDNEISGFEALLRWRHPQRGIVSPAEFIPGYSSLSYLRSFPFDKIKIDQSFVRELSSRSDCVKIVHSIAGLGRSLGMSTTAEGVETYEQLVQLKAAGCTEVQGYYFARPQPVCDLVFSLNSPEARAIKAA